jgi:hypothetical protein
MASSHCVLYGSNLSANRVVMGLQSSDTRLLARRILKRENAKITSESSRRVGFYRSIVCIVVSLLLSCPKNKSASSYHFSCPILSPCLLCSSRPFEIQPRIVVASPWLYDAKAYRKVGKWFRRTAQKELKESFGKSASAKSIYLAAPARFPRFARLFPVWTYLLGHLQAFYRNLGTALDVFVCKILQRCIFGHRAEPKHFPNLFRCFIEGYNYASVFLYLCNALPVNDSSAKPLEYVTDPNSSICWTILIAEPSPANRFWLILRPNWINVFSIHANTGFWEVRKAIHRGRLEPRPIHP